MSEFKIGSILRVEVENFITFKKAVLTPGPQLNMLIGPNGSGKSSMVAAIILGLGGTPKTVGRGTHISEYVRNTCTEATVSIEIKSDNNSSFIIKRQFDIQNKNHWYINDSLTTLKNIYEIIGKLHIQIDNLCQFLPQDRVVEFAKMNKQVLFKSTLEALGRHDLLTAQTNLIEYREKEERLKTELNGLQNNIQDFKRRTAQLQSLVEQTERRNKLSKKVDAVKQKYVWMQYYELHEQYQKVSQRKDEMAKKLKEKTDEIQPIEDQLKLIQSNYVNKRRHFDEALSKVNRYEVAVNSERRSLTSFKLKLTELKGVRDLELQKISDYQAELANFQSKINTYTQQKQDLDKELNNAFTEYKKAETIIIERRNDITRLDVKKREANEKNRTNNFEIRALEIKLEQMQNKTTEHMEKLKNIDHDAYEAAQWIKNNQHLFKRKVHLPIMLELTVNNPKHAIYVENAVPFGDRVGIVCEDKEDMAKLIKILRQERKLAINVLYSDPQESSSMYYPPMKIEHLRQYGFYAYLDSLITAPEAIKTYLLKNHKLHRIPIADKIRNEESIPKEITKYYEGRRLTSISYSKYSNNKIQASSEIRYQETILVGIDHAAIEEVNMKIDNLKRSNEQCEEEVKQIENRSSELQEQVSAQRQKMRSYQELKQSAEKLSERISLVEQQMRAFEQAEKTEDKVLEEYNRRVSETWTQTREVVTKLVNIKSEYQRHFVTMQLAKFVSNQLKRDVDQLQATSAELRQAVEEARSNYNAAKELCETAKSEAKAKLKIAKELSNGLTPDDEAFDKTLYNKLPNSLDELDEVKERLIREIDCILNAADKADIEEYEKTKTLIENSEGQLKMLEVDLEKCQRKVEKCERTFLDPLEMIVANISEKFSEVMDHMEVRGQVDICTGENLKDYSKYGLAIKVAFRDGTPLQELNAHTQSGGERSVSTAAYMLSLQQMTPAPFRCVDEINQGMDEKNERRLFSCIVDATSENNASQYFLITPKLIPNLRYGDNICVHFVHNGPYVMQQEDWNRYCGYS